MENYTKKELLELMATKAVDGKLSQNDLASIIFDKRFPDEHFENGSKLVTEFRDNKENLGTLAKLLESKMKLFKESKIQKDRDKLMEEMEDLGVEMDTLFEYFRNVMK